MQASLLWIPLAFSLANFVPVTKFHWIFEANRELFSLYLIHHLVALVKLISHKPKGYKLISLILAMPTVSYLSAISLPRLDLGQESKVVVSLSEPTVADPDGINVSPEGAFEELSHLDPGEMVKIGKVSVAGRRVVLVVVNINTPWSKFDIYQRKVLLRRLGSIFRHPPQEAFGPALILGNFGAGPLSWDFQQFWREDEFEMIPLNLSSGLGLPLSAHGYLARRSVDDILVKKEGSAFKVLLTKD